MTYSTVEGFVKRSEVPNSVREKLFTQQKETAASDADTSVNKPGKSLFWPWILVIVCLVAVIAYLWFIELPKRMKEPFSGPAIKPEVKPLLAAKNAPEKASPIQPTVLPDDGDFESKVRDLIENNFTDKDFSVEQIAAELGISRVHLSRKLKALETDSPSDMIKARRMQAAADMLRSGERNMTIVAASCGFASSAYFSAAFKAFYGVSPSAFE